MSSTRSKLLLDERSFQGLLAAAFTIQENSDLLKNVNASGSQPTPPAEDSPPKLCRHCSAPLKQDESLCSQCGSEEFRQGERMQRKFASLWEMSREHSVRHERPAQPAEESVLELASSGLVSAPEVAAESAQLGHVAEAPPEETKPGAGASLALGQSVDSKALTITEDDSIPLEIAEDSWLTEADQTSAGSWSTLPGLLQQLKRHRADIYLGVAIFVAFVAILWPTTASPQKPHLTLWQQTLVNLGIAEAPAPTIHYRGDPNIQVWVDPHTALYYCPGDEQYGKAADGRLTRQRDAQADQFEPAFRAACN